MANSVCVALVQSTALHPHPPTNPHFPPLHTPGPPLPRPAAVCQVQTAAGVRVPPCASHHPIGWTPGHHLGGTWAHKGVVRVTHEFIHSTKAGTPTTTGVGKKGASARSVSQRGEVLLAPHHVQIVPWLLGAIHCRLPLYTTCWFIERKCHQHQVQRVTAGLMYMVIR
jgi:hypothetical protein